MTGALLRASLCAALLTLCGPVRAADGAAPAQTGADGGAASEGGADPCAASADPRCPVDEALSLLDRGAAREALALLKAHPGAADADRRYPLALSGAYLAVENRIWAQRALARPLQADPGDCEARAWLTWVLVTGGDLDGALAQLDTPPCPSSPETGARWQLLRAFVERERGADDAARGALAAAQDADVIFEEDVGLLAHLERSLWPAREAPAFVQAEWKVGWTSEPRLGSPVDPPAEGEGEDSAAAAVADAAGLVSELGLLGRLGYRVLPWLLPYVELEARGVVFSAAEAFDLSYVRPGGSAGLSTALGPALTLGASYRFDALLLAGGDVFGAGPVWYSRGHVGELELEVGSWLTATASGGRREYRPRGRTRWEGRLRLGTGLRLGERVFLLLTLSGELNRARNPAYHQWGGTALAEVDIDVWRGWSTRARLSVGADWYPDSADAPEFGTGDEPRRDLQLRPAVAVWTPTWHGLRVALAYEPSWQLSTASAYDFVDHRALLYARWTFRGDPWRPGSVRPADHVALPHGFAAGQAEESLSDRIRELMRQDEEAQRASTCVD
jgi:hypothetical protein